MYLSVKKIVGTVIISIFSSGITYCQEVNKKYLLGEWNFHLNITDDKDQFLMKDSLFLTNIDLIERYLDSSKTCPRLTIESNFFGQHGFSKTLKGKSFGISFGENPVETLKNGYSLYSIIGKWKLKNIGETTHLIFHKVEIKDRKDFSTIRKIERLEYEINVLNRGKLILIKR